MARNKTGTYAASGKGHGTHFVAILKYASTQNKHRVLYRKGAKISRGSLSSEVQGAKRGSATCVPTPGVSIQGTGSISTCVSS